MWYYLLSHNSKLNYLNSSQDPLFVWDKRIPYNYNLEVPNNFPK